MSASTEIVLVNDLAELERLNQLVEEFGGQNHFHVEEQYAVYLCLEEIITNVVNYAWPDGGEHEITVRIAVDEEWIKVEIVDDGIPFDPTAVAQPDTSKPAAERQIGGLGIHLVRQTVNDMFYQRVDDQNVLLLKKKRKTA